MAKLPSNTYRPDLPTFGYGEKSLCSLREPTPKRKAPPLHCYGQRPLGEHFTDDCARWDYWHRNLDGRWGAHPAPTYATVVKQEEAQRQNDTGIFPGWEDIEVVTPALDPLVFLKWDGEVWSKLGHFMHLEAA